MRKRKSEMINVKRILSVIADRSASYESQQMLSWPSSGPAIIGSNLLGLKLREIDDRRL
jgi:hypothetical protein